MDSFGTCGHDVLVAGEVFISYSRKDTSYAHRLAEHLRANGLEVWFDHKIVTGDRFTREIEAKIRACAVFVVLMTPAANESEWVGVELTYALKQDRPVRPLLLSGDEPFFRLVDRNFEDVRPDRMPSDTFVSELRGLVGTSGGQPSSRPPSTRQRPPVKGVAAVLSGVTVVALGVAALLVVPSVGRVPDAGTSPSNGATSSVPAGPTSVPTGPAVGAAGYPAAVRDAMGNQWLFYVDVNGQISSRWRSGDTWYSGTLSGTAARSGTSPVAVIDSTGGQWVYYVDTNGQISTWFKGAGGAWTNETLTGAVVRPGTNPTAVIAGDGSQWVCYVDADGQMSSWTRHSNGEWAAETLTGKQVRPDTSPSAIASASSRWVYYVNTDGQISYWWRTSTGAWTNGTFTGTPVRSGTSPSAVNVSTGAQWIYYINTSGRVASWWVLPGRLVDEREPACGCGGNGHEPNSDRLEQSPVGVVHQ